MNRTGTRFYAARDSLAKDSSYYPEVISACIDSMELIILYNEKYNTKGFIKLK